MRNAYIWFSPRGFANEGTIYVCQSDRVNDLMQTLEHQKNYNEYNSVLTQITRKQAVKDKNFLATGNNYIEENSAEYRINLAYEVTSELLK